MRILTKKYFYNLINSTRIDTRDYIDKEVYCFGHKCKVLSQDTLKYDNITMGIGFNDVFNNRITLSDFELEQYFNLNFDAIHWFMFKQSQFEKYINIINSSQILTLYIDILNENILEKYFDDLEYNLLKFPVNNNIITWIFKNKLQNIKDDNIHNLFKYNIIPENIIKENLDKFNNTHIKYILEYQKLSKDLTDDLKLLKKLYKG